MNLDRTDPGVMVLGPYGGDPYEWAFPISLNPFPSGHTKVFPPRATLGPPDPDVDDTLSTLNFMDLTGGQGIAIVNVSTDLNRFWWGVADTRHTDGWTAPPEPVSGRPSGATDTCTPIGRIGDGMYAFWGTGIHKWNPEAQTWGASLQTITGVVGAPVAFDGKMFFPRGSSGYSYIVETAGVLQAPTNVTGAATPTDPDATTNPRVLLFGVHQQLLWALTTSDEGYTLASSITGATGSWLWPHENAFNRFVTVERSVTPRKLVRWLRPDGGRGLYLVTSRGVLLYNSGDGCWEETNLVDVPPHPNFGRDALPWRPGEDLWIAGGGGDMIQMTSSNVTQPGNGPGGRGQGMPGGNPRAGQGMPATKRGDIISLASDLANMYALVQGDTSTDELTIIEDSAGSDALYVPTASAVSSVLAFTGVGWHPLWETSESSGAPTRIVVSDAPNADGDADYRVFWGLGDTCWSMPCRLTTYSALQGRQRGIDRFAAGGYIEFGEINFGSISGRKLLSHGAIHLRDASAVEYVELEYRTDADETDEWHLLGAASAPFARTVLPFGLSGDGLWSNGLGCYWVQPRLRIITPGGLLTPVVRALSVAYLPLMQDANHATFTIPLPAQTDERTNKTAAQIHNQLHELVDGDQSEKFHVHKVMDRTYRAVITGLSHTEIPDLETDSVGAINLSLIQIPTNAPGLLGEGN